MTSAYSAFPNQGVRMAPLLILEVTDRDGNDARAASRRAARGDSRRHRLHHDEPAAGVVKHGTARASAATLNWPLGGKTGTTDDYTDAWFIGFDPDITIGVWLGFDQKKPIGDNATGTPAALPIWKEIMAAWVDAPPQGAARRRPIFERPGNIVVVVNDAGGVEVFIVGHRTGIGDRAGRT